jgi:hypothetical protein
MVAQLLRAVPAVGLSAGNDARDRGTRESPGTRRCPPYAFTYATLRSSAVQARQICATWR